MTKKQRKAFSRIFEERRNARVVESPFPKLQQWTQSIGMGELLRVVHAPEPEMTFGHCFENVSQKIATAGGKALHGHLFVEIVKQAIQTEAHAVWIDPEGGVRDLTPIDEPGTQKPECILFAPDPSVEGRRSAARSHHLLLSSDTNVKKLFRFEQAVDDWRAAGFVSLTSPPALNFPRLDAIVREAGLPNEVTDALLTVKLEHVLKASPEVRLPNTYSELLER